MSFFGNFAASAASYGEQLPAVLEITLNVAGWVPYDGATPSVAMNLSSGAVSARGRAYYPRVPSGGFQGVTRGVDVRASGLGTVSTRVTVADPDGRVRSALETGLQRGSAAAIWRVVPDSDTDYASIFTGVVHDWSRLPGQTVIELRTAEDVLRTYHPRWPLVRSEWFFMPEDQVGETTPLLYGKQDGTGLTDLPTLEKPHGMIPALPIYIVAGSIAWYTVCLGPASFIKDVYVDGVKQVLSNVYGSAGADCYAVYGSLAGGKTFTIVEFVTIPAEDAVVTVNAFGYQPTNATFDGSGVITNPVDQIRHFLVNWVVERSRGYAPGAWETSATIIDGTSFDDMAAWAIARGIEGARYMTEGRTALEYFREWLESFPALRSFWNAEGQIELCLLTPDWPGYPVEPFPVFVRAEDALSIECDTDSSDITGRITANYLRDSVEGKFLRKMVVEDISSDVLQDASYDLNWSPARQL